MLTIAWTSFRNQDILPSSKHHDLVRIGVPYVPELFSPK